GTLVVPQQTREALLDQYDHVQHPTPNSHLKSRIEPLATTSYSNPRLDYYNYWYEPKLQIKSEWFNNLDSLIEDKEWEEMFGNLSTNPAP
ncbi:1958_t:CDS:2, partial [Gigaspora margarita]